MCKKELSQHENWRKNRKPIRLMIATPFMPLFLLVACLGHIAKHTLDHVGNWWHDVSYDVWQEIKYFPRTIVDVYLWTFTGRDREHERAVEETKEAYRNY